MHFFYFRFRFIALMVLIHSTHAIFFNVGSNLSFHVEIKDATKRDLTIYVNQDYLNKINDEEFYHIY